MKLSYEYIKECIESYGYKLVSDKYTRSSDRLDMICDNGHECSISWDNFKYGRRCKTCANELKSNMFKLDYDKVKSFIESNNCILLSEDYINSGKKLLIQCECGEAYEMPYNKFKHYKKYRKCLNCREKKSKRLTYDYVRSFIENFGYELISETYITTSEKIKVKCPKGHIYSVKFGNFHSGKRCPHCSGNYRMNIDEVKDYFESYGYKCLSSTYKNMSKRLDVICDKGHTTKITLREFKAGCRCKICGMSKGERVIQDYLIGNNINFIYDEPYFKDLLSGLGNPLRPDFILPNEKIWIEYDGEFHYKEMYEGDGHKVIVENDKLKNEYAKNSEWKLIRIPYWEFDNIENILKKKLFNTK